MQCSLSNVWLKFFTAIFFSSRKCRMGDVPRTTFSSIMQRSRVVLIRQFIHDIRKISSKIARNPRAPDPASKNSAQWPASFRRERQFHALELKHFDELFDERILRRCEDTNQRRMSMSSNVARMGRRPISFGNHSGANQILRA